MLRREKYLDKMQGFIERTDFIKVITGMRRTGKSTIMKQIISDLRKNGIDDNKIIEVNLESAKYNFITNHEQLNEYINSNIKGKGKHYIFVDEVQLIDKWELTIASLHSDEKHSIFITGSNSNLLSGELATRLSGRYVSFDICPLDYNEWLKIKGEKKSNHNLLEEYLRFGALPQVAKTDSVDEKIAILDSILESIVYKDIVARANVNKQAILFSLIDYIVTNSSKLISLTSITNYISTNVTKISENTVSKYLKYIIDSLLVYECNKYDLKGKKLLNKLNKIYSNDLGFVFMKSQSDTIDYSIAIETIVFNHLRSNGYDITYAQDNTTKYEIDFIATKRTADAYLKKYIQVSYRIAGNEKVIDREFRSLVNIKDNQPKYIISMDYEDLSKDGIKHINLEDFLLNNDF